MKALRLHLTLLTFILISFSADASHIMGADMSYTYLGRDTANNMVYRVTLNFYRNCCLSCLVAGPNTVLTVKNSCTSASHNYSMQVDSCPNGCEVSYFCPSYAGQTLCGSGAYPGIKKYIDTADIVLNDTCSQWVVSWTDGSRTASISNLTNPGAQSIYIEMVINNTIDPATGSNYVDHSPLFVSDPPGFVCVNTLTPYTLIHSGVDPDGDSLVYSLVNPLTAANSPISFLSGFNANRPVSSLYPEIFDSTTGLLYLIPMQQELDQYAVKISEYRRGVLIGSAIRDVALRIFNCSSAGFEPVSTPQVEQGGYMGADSIIYACPGGDLIIDIPFADTTGRALTLTSDIQTYPYIFPGMTFSQLGTGTLDTARIEWVGVDTGCRYIEVKALTSDCPLPEYVVKIIKICGRTGVHVQGSGMSVYCGGRPVTLTGSGGLTSAWTPSAGLSTTIGNMTQARPTVPTWYHFTNSCGSDSVFVNTVASPLYTVSGDTTICIGSSAHIAVTMSSTGSYSYQWSPVSGLYNSVGGSMTSTIAAPTVMSNVSHLYYCTITDTSGCIIDTSVWVGVRGTGPISLIADTLIQSGSTSILQALLKYSDPGFPTIPAANVIEQAQVQIGSGVFIQPNISSAYPSPYGNYQKSARHQILFHSSELSVAFGAERLISSISLQIGRLGTATSLSNFTIRMGNTRQDSLSGGYALVPLYTVYDHTDTPVLGFNTHVFDDAFVWDGVSNVIVDICFADTGTVLSNSQMTYSLTTFKSVYCTYGNIDMCGVSGGQTTPFPTSSSYYQRPNVKFGIGAEKWHGNMGTLQWLPVGGSNTVNNTTSNPTTANPTSSQWYTAIINDTLCPQTDSIYVTVTTSGIVPTHSNQDTTLCAGAPLLLQAGGALTYRWTDHLGSILSTDSSFTYTALVSSLVYLHMTGTGGVVYDDTTYITVPSVSISPVDTTLFGAGGSVTIVASSAVSYQWSVGSTIISTGSSVTINATQDTVVVLTANSGSCVIHDFCHIYVIAGPQPFYTNQDTLVCPGASVTLTSHNAASYSWTDSHGNVLSTDSSFTYIANASNFIYLHMTDGSGHSYFDTTYITVPVLTVSVVDTTIYSSVPVTFTASAASFYIWTANGANVSSTSSVTITAPRDELITLLAFNSGCTLYDTCHIHFMNKVWPGDANSDLVADNNDILAIGMAFGDTGAVRPHTSLVWVGQPVSSWDSTFATGVNCAHADCDGNGVVDYNDTIAVYQNYGLTHAKHNGSRSGQYPIYITTDKQLYGPTDTIRVQLNLSDGRNLIHKIYGIAYSFDMTSAATGQIISMNQKNSWLSTGLTFERLSSASSAQLAQCRVSHVDTTGYGTIAEIDILCSHISQAIDSATFMVSNIRAITARGDSVTFSIQPQTVAISQYPLGIEPTDAEHSIELYPNPNTGSFRVIQSSAMRTKMTVTDELGRVVYETYLTDRSGSIDIGKVPSGIYTATFTSATSHESRRVVVGR